MGRVTKIVVAREFGIFQNPSHRCHSEPFDFAQDRLRRGIPQCNLQVTSRGVSTSLDMTEAYSEPGHSPQHPVAAVFQNPF